MAADCLHEPQVIAFAKTFGASIGILGAALAWLLNNALRWLVWLISERRREYELIKGLKAEIASNAASESNWAGAANGEKLIATLRSDRGPYKPWAPYVAVVEANFVFDSVKDTINRLPADVIVTLVEYYNLTAGLTKQLGDFRSEAYTQLSHDRQIYVIRGVYALGDEVAAAAARAEAALAQRLRRLNVINAASIALAAFAAALYLPSLFEALGAYIESSVKPAVEWASSCDLASKNKPLLQINIAPN